MGKLIQLKDYKKKKEKSMSRQDRIKQTERELKTLLNKISDLTKKSK